VSACVLDAPVHAPGTADVCARKVPWRSRALRSRQLGAPAELRQHARRSVARARGVHRRAPSSRGSEAPDYRVNEKKRCSVESRLFFPGTSGGAVLFFNYQGKLSKEKHMKKNDKRQKLALSRETLRRLESSQLADVAGGTLITCNPAKCTSGYAVSVEAPCWSLAEPC
jgi:DNA-binding Xre family transcriptional regulator